MLFLKKRNLFFFYDDIKKANFVCDKGVIFINKSKIIKILFDKNRKIDKNISDDTICEFNDTIFNNILIRAILKRAYERKKIIEDLSEYFIEIKSVKMSVQESEKIKLNRERDIFYQNTVTQFQLTTEHFLTF